MSKQLKITRASFLPYSIGWFGEPEAPSSQSTMTHIVDDSEHKPVCGCSITSKKEFQVCTGYVSQNLLDRGYIECSRCKQIAKRSL